MKNKLTNIALITFSTTLLALSTHADEEFPALSMKSNSQLIYNQTPKEVGCLSKVFTQGMFYGRMRSNTFYQRYVSDTQNSDHLVSALGASLIFKSATLYDLDFTTGGYLSIADYWDRNDHIYDLTKGKDLLSRYDFANSSSHHMAVMGQNYLRYSGIDETEILLGRQLVETFYTASNDTKMIPNSFDGAVLQTKAVPNTKVKVAYLYKQKLRDHTKAHSVLMYGDSNSTFAEDPQWSQNDDSAMHKGLTYTALKAAGKPTDAPLIVVDIKNNSIKNSNLDTSFYSVPELISQGMIEANYKINFNGFSITPGMRYIKQFDKGAGAIGGASYSANTTGYKDPGTLDSQMLGLRVVMKTEEYKLNLGYTNVLDEADLITPWRGFPTAGYTRSMARYNWKANTKSYRLELTKDTGNKGIYEDIFTQISILYTDADEDKGSKDQLYYYIGFVQNDPNLLNLQWRLRLGYEQNVDTKYTAKDNLDARFEINYLF